MTKSPASQPIDSPEATEPSPPASAPELAERMSAEAAGRLPGGVARLGGGRLDTARVDAARQQGRQGFGSKTGGPDRIAAASRFAAAAGRPGGHASRDRSRHARRTGAEPDQHRAP